MKYRLLVIIMTCTLLVGGSLQSVAAAELPPGMLGVTWELVSMQAAGQPVENTTGAGLTIAFTGKDTVSGFGGCNQFSGNYTVANEGTMAFRALATTLRACTTADVTEREARYFTTLREVAGFVLDSPTSMRLTFAQQGLQLVYRRGAAVVTLPSTGGGGMATGGINAWPPFALALALGGFLLAQGFRRRTQRG